MILPSTRFLSSCMCLYTFVRACVRACSCVCVHSFKEWLHERAFWCICDNERLCVARVAQFPPQLPLSDLLKQDPVTSLPDEYVMPGRVSVLLRGMGAAFGIKIQTASAWVPHARALLDSPAA